MVAKTSANGRPYEIDGRYVVWTPEVWEDEPALPAVRIPLRVKLGVVLDLGEKNIALTSENMRAMLLRVVPVAEATITDMDVNDFQDMFQTWMSEYNQVTGASLGESSASVAS